MTFFSVFFLPSVWLQIPSVLLEILQCDFRSFNVTSDPSVWLQILQCDFKFLRFLRGNLGLMHSTKLYRLHWFRCTILQIDWLITSEVIKLNYIDSNLHQPKCTYIFCIFVVFSSIYFFCFCLWYNLPTPHYNVFIYTSPSIFTQPASLFLPSRSAHSRLFYADIL